MTAAIVAAVYALLLAALWRPLRALRPCTLRDAAEAIGAFAAAYGVAGAIGALIAPRWWAAALEILGGIGSDDGRLGSAGPALAALILFRACLLAPLVEELLFRGALYGWLRRRLPAWATIALTSTAFAAIHSFPAVLPLAFALGISAGWARERTGSPAAPIVAHALHNVLMVSASYAFTGWTARLPPW